MANFKRGTVGTAFPESRSTGWAHTWRTWDDGDYPVSTRRGAARGRLSTADARRRACYGY